MADPTIKDVLETLAEMRAAMATKSDLARLEAKLEAHRAETNAHRAETNAHRAETTKGFADRDRELTRHADVHREIEKDIEALKRRPPRTAARPTPRRR